MKHLKSLILNRIRGITVAGFRFPMTVVGLLATAIVMISLIATNWKQEFMHEKLMLTFLLASIVGIAVQFITERFHQLVKMRLLLYAVACIFVIGYFMMVNQELKISDRNVIRSFVLIFALFCIVLWIPSHKSLVDFNKVALVHVKAAVTSFLYSGVLSIGFAAIIAAVNILLFDISMKSYTYVMVVIWIVFAPIYYLSLLPRFHAKEQEEQRKFEEVSIYPKFLEILVSYIAIPLISAFTLVLIAYFLKILFTLTWPSGQIGPMVLLYSIAGLAIYILASLLENKFALFYRTFFPIILLPIVIIQFISIGIRVRSYGITESRYYLLLFSIFAFLTGCMLMMKRVFHNGHLVVIAALLAMISVIPPIDAFTVSRISQMNRLEDILRREEMLKDKNITKKEVEQETKVEITSILDYLDQNNELSQLSWLPEDFEFDQDMEKVFGFGSTYNNNPGEYQYKSVSLDRQVPFPVKGYDILVQTNTSRAKKEKNPTVSDFILDGETYHLIINYNSDTRVSIEDDHGFELVSTTITEFTQTLIKNQEEGEDSFTPEELSIEVRNNGYQLKIIFENIHAMLVNDKVDQVDYSMYVLFAVP